MQNKKKQAQTEAIKKYADINAMSFEKASKEFQELNQTKKRKFITQYS